MYKYIKRLMDILLALIGLVFAFVPMIIVAIAIKLESKGPIIFKQERTGKDGKTFKLYKFRSMTVDNDVLNFKTENKITKVGKFIRKTSLDELPQFFNIIKGDMSFIGPRPWITEYYNNFNEHQKRRVEVLPGITGLAQSIGRNNLNIFEKINYDIEYIDNFSFKMDLKVVLMTIKTVLSKEGAELSKYGIKEEIEDLKAQNA
ncbi:MAG: sugar transferase [Bacilli bacterium]|nr:sugar transferase [Bacilli bacterium]